MPRLLPVLLGIAFLLGTSMGIAQEPKEEIQKLLTEVEQKFDQGDPRGLAACWTPDGVFINRSGERFTGRENLEKTFQASFSAGKKVSLRFHVRSLRIVGEGVALVDVLPEVRPQTRTLGGEPNLDLVLVQRNGRWLIESAREIRCAPVQVQHLKDLEWLVGDWASEASPQSGVSLHSTCGWTDSRAFLIRKYTVEGKDGVLHSGTEVIGWDPRARRIRSWVFDSNGGFGENVWFHDGNRWLVQYSGTLKDGNEVSATNILTVVDPDTLRIQSKDRTSDGEPQPDVPGITLKRQAAAKDASKTGESRKPAQTILP
ncbi:MAG: SgcJ/EcaC family oxidoreductase [Pirellulales bacterium]|nr:SgcJ/EcaC family oxidoreductase [Pirellulales bacterium]